MIDFFSSHTYLQWVLWSLWAPLLIIWPLFYKTLLRYPRTLIKVTLGSLVFGVTWDYVAIGTNIWSYPKGCCIQARLGILPFEELVWIVSAALLISSLTILFYKATHKKRSRI